MRRAVTLTNAAALVAALAACSPATSEARPDGEPAATASPQTAPMRSETREFRDWWLVCDNGNACFAFGFAPEFGAGWVRIAMEPGPDAQPSVVFGLMGEDFFRGRETGAPTPPLSLVVDGRSFSGVATAAAGEDFPVGELRTGARAAVAAIAAGRTMEVRAGDTTTISTSGASAALLWIDERQGRLNTPTALLRRGDRQASSVPAPPALPVIRAAATADQTGFGDDKQTLPQTLRALPAVTECLAESDNSEWLRENIMSARLDARTELWAVPCGAGAYNVSHNWFITGPNGANPRPAALLGSEGARTDDAADDWPDNATINGGYDPATRTLTAFAKGRGLGDCGTAQTWTWTGRQFELSAESSMGQCAGVAFDYWPTTWRSR